MTRGRRALSLVLQLATLELKLDAFVFALERWYRPDQPRAPRGTPIGGQWIDAGGADRLPPACSRVAQAVDGFRKHGIHQVITRGVSPAAMLDALRSPVSIRPRPNGTTQYIGARATVVLNGTASSYRVEQIGCPMTTASESQTS